MDSKIVTEMSFYLKYNILLLYYRAIVEFSIKINSNILKIQKISV